MTRPLIPHFTVSCLPRDPDTPCTELKKLTMRQVSSHFGSERALSLVGGKTVVGGKGDRYRVISVEMLPSPREDEIGAAFQGRSPTVPDPDVEYDYRYVETFKFPTLKEATAKVEWILGSPQGGYSELKCYRDTLARAFVVVFSSSWRDYE